MTRRLPLAGALALSAVVFLGAAGCSSRPLTGRYLVTADHVVEVLDARGTVERVVAREGDTSSFSDVRWSPDGSMLAWIGDEGVIVQRADARSRPRLLVSTPTSCSLLCGPLTFVWSPDGRKLLVGGAGSPVGLLSVVPVEGGRARSLATAQSGTYYRAIGWARDEIVYTRASEDVEPCCTPGLDLIVARPDGSGQRTLFSFADGGVHDSPSAALSPDGRYLAFTSEGRSRPDPRLGVIDVGCGTMRTIRAVNPPGQRPPVWAPDSREFAVASYQVGDTSDRVTVFAAEGPRRHELGAVGYPVAWDRIGLTIVLGRNGTSPTLVSRSDGRGAARILFRMPNEQSILTIDVRTPGASVRRR
jgi:WD40-like Beta Propeller Repeat